MVNGQISYSPIPQYEDYESLKKYIRSNLGQKYDHTILNRFSFTQSGTGSEVEISEKGGLTITDMPSTELTIVGAMSANDDEYDGAIATLKYYNKGGTEHTATCVINTTDSTTEVDFLDIETGLVAVVDYAVPISLTLSVEVKTGHTFGMGTTGSLTYGVIQAGATEAVDEDLIGIGQIYGYYSNDDASYRDIIQYISYTNFWGEIKYAYVHTDDTDATTKVKMLQGTLNSTGFSQSDWNIPNIKAHVTPTTNSVKDFWRLRTLDIEVTPESGHNFQLGNSDGSVIYNCVEEGNYESYHSRYVCPSDCDAWIARIMLSTSVITNVVTNVGMYYTPLGEDHQHYIDLAVGNNSNMIVDPIVPLKPGSEVKFTIVGNLSKNIIDIHILEAINK